MGSPRRNGIFIRCENAADGITRSRYDLVKSTKRSVKSYRYKVPGVTRGDTLVQSKF